MNVMTRIKEVAANHDRQSDEMTSAAHSVPAVAAQLSRCDKFYVLSHSIAPKLNETSTVSIYEFSYFSSFNGKTGNLRRVVLIVSG